MRTGPDHTIDRRAVLHILAALGFAGAPAAELAAQARPAVSAAALREAATLLDGSFDAARMAVAERAVQRNIEQMQAVRALVLDDAIEPALVFAPLR